MAEHDREILELWGKKLLEQSKLFNMEALPSTLKRFPDIIHSRASLLPEKKR